MITFGRKLKHLRQKNHLTQKELGMAVGFPDSCADVRIAQYESDVRTPKEDLMKLFASTLGVPVELFTVPVLSEPREYEAAVITNVLEELNLNIGADAIRSKCKVTEIIPPDEEVKKQALLEAGEEYTYFPTDYVVSFSVGSEYSQDFARTVLDSIIKNYFATYGEKYINQQTLPNNNVRGTGCVSARNAGA